MSAPLSDADVFGAPEPRLLSDADVFGKPQTDTDVGLTPDYWSAPRVSADAPTRFVDLIRHPIASIQALGQRAKDVAGDTFQHGTLLGAGIGGATDATVGGVLGPAEAARMKEDERAARPRGSGSVLEGITDFAAGAAGSLPSPESWVDAPVKIAMAGKPILSRILSRGLGAAAANVATDPLVQGANMARGVQDNYNVEQTALAAPLGFAVGGGAGLAHEAQAGAKALNDVGRWMRETPSLANGGDVPGWKPASQQALEDATRGPATADSLWTRLIAQESRGDQGAVSKKGATGRAQLMPTTAEEVARRIGRPELADWAMEDSPLGAVANEVLGKTYLNEQLQAFGGDPVLALAAYNAGPGHVREWVKQFGHPDEVGRARWLAMVPFKETRNYVHTILGDVTGAPHTLTPADHDYMRGRMDSFPDAETPLPPLQPDAVDAAAQAADEAAQAHAGGVEPTLDTPEPFPGDIPHEPFPGDLPPPAHLPDEAAPTAIPPGQDLTEQALNQMRDGKKLRMGEGPSLAEGLVSAGGVRDEGGELTNLLGGDGENRLLKMLRRKTTGMTLDEAVEWAHDRGYIGDPDSAMRPDQSVLLEALRREVAGEKIFPPERINEHARALQEHIQDLEEILHHVGMDPKEHTNEQIRAAMDDWMHAADHPEHELEPGSMGLKVNTGEVLGLNPKEAMATGATAVQNARDAAQRVALRNEIMATTRSGMLAGARSPTDNPAPRVDPNDPNSAPDLSALPQVRGIPDIVRRLADALGFPVRQGRLGMRGALGTYNRRSGMVRSKGRYDLNVMAHEFAHALEFTDGHRLPNVVAAMKAHAKTLKALDYNPKAGRRHEGFAEWMRWYITNPAYADRLPGAAAFRQDFEAALAKDDPKALAAIQEAQVSYQAFLDAPSLVATREHVIAPPSQHPLAKLMRLGAGKGPLGALRDIGDEAYRGVVDFLHPWKKAVDYALDVIETHQGVRPKLSVSQDPYKLLRSMASVAATGHMDLLHGVHGYHSLEPDSPSFVEALTSALGDRFLKWDEGAIRDFGTYLVGRRVIHLYDKVGRVYQDAEGRQHGLDQPPDNLSKEAWTRTVQDFEAANPHWADAAAQLYEWNGALWRKRHDAGLISEADYLAGIEDHPDYVPLFRDISDKEFGGDVGGKRGSATKNAGGTVRLKGSDRAYINPLHSMMDMAYELNAQIARNDALKALDDLGRIAGPDAGRVVERIPPRDIRGTATSVEEVIANAARQYGVGRRDAMVITDAIREMFDTDADDAMNATIYRAKDTGENGEPIVYVWRDGERIPLRLPDGKWGKHMVEGLAGMTAPIRSLLLDIATMPARALRAGVTAHPAFFLANSFRDQMTAFVLTNVGYRPFWDQARGLTHEVHNHIPGQTDELSRLYNVASGEVGGFQSAAEHEAHRKADLQALRQKGATIRHFATWNGFAHFTEISETGTRLGIFERALHDARTRGGLGDYDAAREAAFQARDYMDFDRHGDWASMRILARVIPFMNAGIQALDKTRRVATPGITLLPKIIRPLFGKGAPATPEEYREFSHAMKLWITASALAVGGLSIRAAYKDDPEYQEVADTVRNTHWVVKLPNDEYAVIPKPYETAVLSNIFERAFEATALHDSTAWGRLTQGLEDIFIPAHDPAFLMPVVDVLRNRDNMGAPIVPDYLKDKQAKDQYTDRTSDIAKWMGAHVGGQEGISPAVIDFLAKQWGGSNARDALDADRQRAPLGRDPADTFVAKRFIKDWTRGAVSTKAFYDLTSTSDGTWAHAVASVEGLINDGSYPDAIARLKGMTPAERSFVLISVFGKGEAKQDHPMIRAQAAAGVFSGVARDLMDGNVRGPDLQPIPITPDQRRDAIQALHKVAVAEQRNALIAAGVPGWEQREPLPEVQYLHELQTAAPQVIPALAARFQAEKVRDLNVTLANWAASRHIVEAQIPDQTLTAMMQLKRFPDAKNGDPTAAAKKRAMADVAPVGH